jgi:hypothetical protein
VRKLRRFHSADETRKLYATSYDHTHWAEHIERVIKTRKIAQDLIDTYALRTAADLSAGDRSLASELQGLDMLETSDLSTGTNIVEGLLTLSPVDLFICTETIEHLEAPWSVIELIAQRTNWLVLSTPLDEPAETGNWEHYWSFTKQDIENMLAQSGFTDLSVSYLTRPAWTYIYQIWTARTSA